MAFEVLTDENFVLYCAKHYNNPHCTDTAEFFEDLNRIKYLKRLFNRFEESGEIKERLVLNHIIIIYNVFGPAATRMLFFKIPEKQYSLLKPFLIKLGYMTESISNLGKQGALIRSSDIPMNAYIVEVLRGI